jgi:hypothetical protein
VPVGEASNTGFEIRRPTLEQELERSKSTTTVLGKRITNGSVYYLVKFYDRRRYVCDLGVSPSLKKLFNEYDDTHGKQAAEEEEMPSVPDLDEVAITSEEGSSSVEEDKEITSSLSKKRRSARFENQPLSKKRAVITPSDDEPAEKKVTSRKRKGAQVKEPRPSKTQKVAAGAPLSYSRSKRAGICLLSFKFNFVYIF